MSAFSEILDLFKSKSDWPAEAVMAALATMAVATLNGLQEEELLRFLHKKSGFTMNTLKRAFAQVRMEHGIVPTDTGMEVAKKVFES